MKNIDTQSPDRDKAGFGIFWWLPKSEMATWAKDLCHAKQMLAADHADDLPPFFTANAIHPCDALENNLHVRLIADQIEQIFEDHLNEVVGSDLTAISLSPEHLDRLGSIVNDFYRTHGKVNAWAIDEIKTLHAESSGEIGSGDLSP